MLKPSTCKSFRARHYWTNFGQLGWYRLTKLVMEAANFEPSFCGSNMLKPSKTPQWLFSGVVQKSGNLFRMGPVTDVLPTPSTYLLTSYQLAQFWKKNKKNNRIQCRYERLDERQSCSPKSHGTWGPSLPPRIPIGLTPRPGPNSLRPLAVHSCFGPTVNASPRTHVGWKYGWNITEFEAMISLHNHLQKILIWSNMI